MRARKHIHILFFLFLNWICPSIGFGQMRMVMNGGMIVLSDSATLVIGNGNANAITRNNGHIISEGEENKVRWNIGTNTGTYTVPLGYNTEYLPISFTKSGGTGSGGYFTFSTYGTGWQNSANKPSSVGNVNRNGVDNSAFTVDRFWGISASGYTGKPNLSNFTLTYRRAEVTASGNYIVEREMMLQRWNPSINDWADYNPPTIVDTANRTVMVSTVNGNNLFKWWTISAGAMNGLPVELTKFEGSCYDGIRTIYWETASEQNSANFTVQNSPDGLTWNDVQTVYAAGSSNRVIRYSIIDAESSTAHLYYRLKQSDLDGSFRYFDIIRVECGSEMVEQVPELYPNPSNGLFNLRHLAPGAQVEVINTIGEVVYSARYDEADAQIDLQSMTKGLYYVAVRNGQQATTFRLVIQ